MKTFLLCALLAGSVGAWADGTLIKVETTSGTTNEEFTLGTVGTGNFYVTITPADDSKSSYGTGNYNYARTSDATEYFTTSAVWKIGGSMNGTSRKMVFNIPSAGTLYVYARTGKSGDTRSITVNEQTVSFDPPTTTISKKTCYVGRAITFTTSGSYSATATASINFSAFEFVPAPAVAPGAISYSPVAGSVAEGSTVTLTSSNATTILYQWGSAAIDGGGDWSGAATYSNSNKPVVPAEGSTNTVLSVKATNAYGSTYGSATYTPVKMAYKTIYSIADGIGSAEVTASDATVNDGTSLVLSNTAGRIKLTAASGFQFKNGDAISFSGTIGNAAKKYGISYGPTTSLGTELSVAAGAACNVSGTLTLASATNDLYIGRADGSTTTMTSFVIRQLKAATSEEFTGVKIDGSAATENIDYTIEGTTITLSEDFTAAPNVALVNHIVFADASTEDQNLVVPFGNPDGEFFTGTVTIDGTTYTVKAPCGQINALKVEYKSGETVIKEEHLDVTGLKVGASYTVPFRMYVEKDGALYQTTKNGSDPYYGDAVTLAYNTTVTKSLSPVELNGGTIVLFEDFDGDASQNANIRASNCSAYNNTAYTSANNLPAGTYTFIVKAQNKGRGSSVKVGETTVFSITDVNSSTGSWTDKTFTDVVVPAAGKLSFVAGGSSTIDCYDILIAICAPVSVTANAYGYQTFASDSPLDFSATSTKAYIATGESAGKVTMTKVTKVPAGTGVLLQCDADETIPVLSGDADDVSANKFVRGTGAAVAKGTTTNRYVLGVDGSSVAFYQINATSATVSTSQAYLEIPATAARLTISLEDETTGLKTIDNELTIDNVVYDLQGRRVAQPTKGLYIVNGKKVIVK